MVLSAGLELLGGEYFETCCHLVSQLDCFEILRIAIMTLQGNIAHGGLGLEMIVVSVFRFYDPKNISEFLSQRLY